MKDKNISLTNSNQLSQEEEMKLNEQIKRASKTEVRRIAVSDEETKDAFQTVAEKTGIKTEKRSPFNLSRYYYAAAAVIACFVIGMAYLFNPIKVSTGTDDIRIIQLSDETTVTLNSNSTLTYARWFNWTDRAVSLNGEAFFEVSTTGKSFSVITQNAQITVMGTAFNVRTDTSRHANKTVVYLKEGRVAFAPKNKEKQAIMLHPGQISMISDQYPDPLPPARANQTEMTDWLQKKLSFEDKTLSAIFKLLEDRYRVNIKVKTKRILDDKLTIYISDPKGIEQTLNDICQAKGLHYLQQGDTFTILEDV